MREFAQNSGLIDLLHLDQPSAIAAALLDGADGPALVDPGPSVTLPILREALAGVGVAVTDLRAILLTHIHLDHAGATGTLVRENPRIRVHVHERGAKHLVDPSRLIESATRIYGDEMDTLWGEFLPVPADRIEALVGGERLQVAGRRIEVAYTPGHAWHHVAYFDLSTGVAFTGDVAGIRLDDRPFVLPPTPPPDIEIERWRESLDRIRDWAPELLFLTHFGPATGVDEHLAELDERLGRWAEVVRASLEQDASDEERARDFAEHAVVELRARLSEADARDYETAGGIEEGWYGLARYWRKRMEG